MLAAPLAMRSATATLPDASARSRESDRRVAGHDLEESEVVAVELVESELRDDDDAHHARAELQRDGEQRLLDLRRSGDLLAELVVRCVPDYQ